MITFDAPLLIWAAPGVGVGVGRAAAWVRRRRVACARGWSAALYQRARSTGRRAPLVVGVAAAFATLGLAGPRWGRRVVTVEAQALNLVIAVDISRSMLAEDVAPSRLERATRQARRLVHDLAGDRIGLLAFSSASYTLAPLTVDVDALDLWIEGLDPELASAGGTALAPVLRQGRDLLFGGGDLADRVLVVFTDGEAHDSLEEIVGAAVRLRRNGIRLILVAEGGREPVPIPVRDASGKLAGYQRDPSGQVVETRRRDDILAAVADAAQGMVVAAEVDDQAGTARRLVADYRRAPQSATLAGEAVPRGWLLALAAALVLLAHTITRRTLALVGVVLAVSVEAVPAQAPRDPAYRAWSRGARRQAAELYLARARRGAPNDTNWYNLGTAALAVGDTALARHALRQAAQSVEPGLRFRARYNLGVLELESALRDTARAAAHAAAAAEHYREALLLDPRHRGAKWNLELALRLRGPPGGRAARGEGTGQPPSAAPPAPGLTAQQAEQVLTSLAEAERRTWRERLRRQRQVAETRGRREW